MPPSKLVDSPFRETFIDFSKKVSLEGFQDEYKMCNPKWSPNYAVQDFSLPVVSEFKLEFVDIENLIQYLEFLKVTSSWTDAISALRSFKASSTSPGPGYSSSFSSRNDIFLAIYLFLQYDPFNIMIKEEVSKASKVDSGDYRIIFNSPTNLVIHMKQFCYAFNKSLSDVGFMIKGGDLRSTIAVIAQNSFSQCMIGKFVYQGDASKCDRTISRSDMHLIYRLRNYFNEKFLVPLIPIEIIKAICEFKFTWFDPDSNQLNYVDSQRGNPSGQPNTTEDETLLFCAYLIKFYSLVHPGFLFGFDFQFCGTGDDWHLIVSRPIDVVSLRLFFSSYGLIMKCWQVSQPSHFDLMGASLGLNDMPYWNMKRMLVHNLYHKKNETDYELASKLVSQYCYLVYHPNGRDYKSLVLNIVSQLNLSLLERAVLIREINNPFKYYLCFETFPHFSWKEVVEK